MQVIDIGRRCKENESAYGGYEFVKIHLVQGLECLLDISEFIFALDEL